MRSISGGIWPTMITPYGEDGKIHFGAVPAMVDFYVQRGCHGIFAVCQSSEMFALSLKERVELAAAVVDAARGRIEVIASGHISPGRAEQIEELGRIWETGVSAVVMVTNRLAGQEEGDEVWISNASALLDALPQATFGLYECPAPYKRLLTEKTLRWCASSGRFAFLKDTCCDAGLIAQRLGWIKDQSALSAQPPLGLFNANSATLLDSLRAGAAGFSGVMANLHPELYVWLYQNYASQPGRAEELQALLSMVSLMEGQGYPILAKQHMIEEGIPMTLHARTQPPQAFGPMQKYLMKQVRTLENAAARELGL